MGGQKEVREYNQANQITEVDYHGDKLLNTYSSQDNEINHHWGQLQNFSLNRSGKTSLEVDLNFNGFNQPSARQTKEGSQTTLLNTYDYDASKRLIRQRKFSGQANTADLNFTENDTYDSLNQLTDQATTATGNEQVSPTHQSYLYDGNGNVIGINSNGAPSTVIYNALDQRTDQTYDDNGRIIKDKSGNHYVYNELDQLVKRTGADRYGDVVNYNYYPDGLLAQRINGNNTQQFYYRDGQVSVIKTIKGSDKPIWTDFLLVGGMRLAAYSSDTSVSPTYYLLSHKSTGASLQGGKLQGFYYDAYGKDASFSQHPEGAPIPKPINQQSNKSFTWDQEYRDPATELTYLRARFYNPEVRSFMSMDSAMVDNKYNFGNRDPIGMIDPSGHMPKWARVLTTAVVGAAMLYLAVMTGGAAVPEEVGVAAEEGVSVASTAVIAAKASIALAGISYATAVAGSAADGEMAGEVSGEIETNLAELASKNTRTGFGEDFISDVGRRPYTFNGKPIDVEDVEELLNEHPLLTHVHQALSSDIIDHVRTVSGFEKLGYYMDKAKTTGLLFNISSEDASLTVQGGFSFSPNPKIAGSTDLLESLSQSEGVKGGGPNPYFASMIGGDVNFTTTIEKGAMRTAYRVSF